jgi:hypothetical protein
VHDPDELAEFIDDVSLGVVPPEQEIGDVSGNLRNIFAGQTEALRVSKHDLVQVVDELPATLSHLARKEAAQRPLPSTNAAARFVERRADSFGRQSIGTREPRQTSSNDAHVH